MTPLRQRMLEELQRRNYAIDTIRGYILAVEQFARYFRKSPELMGAEEIGQFQLHLLREKKLAVGTIALRMGALRFLYKKTLKRRDLDFDDLPLLKTPKKLPVVLSPEEVTRLIEAAPNLFYRTLLMVLYATGLRRAEVAHLKVSDIDRLHPLVRPQSMRARDQRDHETATLASKIARRTAAHELLARRPRSSRGCTCSRPARNPPGQGKPDPPLKTNGGDACHEAAACVPAFTKRIRSLYLAALLQRTFLLGVGRRSAHDPVAAGASVFKGHRHLPASVAPPSPRRYQSVGSDYSARVPEVS